MPDQERLSKHSRSGFPTTRWSLVLRAGHGSPEESRAALAELCGAYWFPLYGFVRKKGYRAEDAEDLVQGFFAKFLAGEYLKRADAEKGRFRSYLLGSMIHHAANEQSRLRAGKRGGERRDLPLEIDFADGERRLLVDPATDSTPEKYYDRRWALTLLDQALSSLKRRYERHGKSRQFDELSRFLAGDAGEGPYDVAAERLGTTVGAVKVAVHRMRRRLQEAVREEIRHTVADEAAIDAEIRFLFEVLGS